MTDRRQHLLADGSRSRGFVAVEVELLDAPVSPMAKALLLCVRREIDRAETDGWMELRHARVLASAAGIRSSQVSALVAELSHAGLVDIDGGRWYDRNYLVWSRSHGEREERREGWVGRQQSRRDNLRDSRRESRVSHGDVTRDVTPPPHTPPIAPAPTQAVVEVPSEPPRDVAEKPMSRRDSVPDRPDVLQLCQRMVELNEEREAHRYCKITEAWKREARLLLDRDGVSLEEAIAVLEWAARDSFWGPNILGIPKLREKFDQLRLQRDRRGPANGAAEPDWRRYSTKLGGDLAPGAVQ